MSTVLPEHEHDPQLTAATISKRKFDELGVVDSVPASVDTSGSRWYPSSIIIEARTFDGTAVNADLMTVIGRGVKANKCTLSERLYLPSQYNQNNAEYRAKTIAPIFASACACAGCEVRLKGWEKSKGFLKFVCPQYRRYKSTSKQQQQQQQLLLMQPSSPSSATAAVSSPPLTEVANSSTNSLEDMFSSDANKKSKASNRAISRPLDKESTCPFSFLVFWEEYSGQESIPADTRKGRWFVCATGAGTPYHEGHSRKEFSEGELRRKQLQVEGAYDILMPYYKKIVELVDRDEDKLNQAIGRLNGLIDGLKRQQQQQHLQQQLGNGVVQNGSHHPATHLITHKLESPLVDSSLDVHSAGDVHSGDVHPVDVHAVIKLESLVDDHHSPLDDQHHHHEEHHQDGMIHTNDAGLHTSAEATAAALLDQAVMNEEMV